MALTNSLEVLKKVKKAFDDKLIDCADRVSVAKRKEVIALRKEIEQAIDDGEVLGRARTVSDKLSPAVRRALSGYL